jgi:hypothetical protein
MHPAFRAMVRPVAAQAATVGETMDERPIGEAAPNPWVAEARSDPRPLGALLGMALALSILVALYAIGRRLDPQAAFLLEPVFGRDGITHGQATALLVAWATGPVAAGIAGWVMAKRAAGEVAWAGAWMGAITYVLAIAIAPLSVVVAAIGDRAGTDIASALGEVPILWVLGGVILAPLAIACIISGMVWAATLRLVRGPAGRRPPGSIPAGLPGAPLLAVGVLLGLAWVVLMSMFSTIGAIGPGGID